MTSYQKLIVNISQNPIDLSSPPSLLDTATLSDTVFLKILQTGKNVTLYAYTDNIKTRLYIKTSNINVPDELIYGIYQGNDNGVIDKSTFHDQLNQLAVTYTSGSGRLPERIQQSRYNADDIIPIIAEINGISQKRLALEVSHHPEFRFYIGAGYNSSTLKYSSGSPYYGASPSSSGSPGITLGMDAFANPDIARLFFRLELGYRSASYNFTGQENPLDNAASPVTTLIKIKENVVSVMPQIVFNIYNSSPLKVFVDFGYTINSLPGSTIKFDMIQDAKTINSTQESISNSEYKNEYSSFQIKAGVVINKQLELYGSYYPSVVTTNSVYYEADLTAYQIGLNYLFGKK